MAVNNDLIYPDALCFPSREADLITRNYRPSQPEFNWPEAGFSSGTPKGSGVEY